MTNSDTDTANDRFIVPAGAHWSDVRTAARNVGRAMLRAFQAIEAANPERLQGVFGSAPWTDKGQLTATFRRVDGRTLHVRKAIRAEAPQQAIYDALGVGSPCSRLGGFRWR